MRGAHHRRRQARRRHLVLTMSMTKLKPGEEVGFLKEIHGTANYEGLFGVVKDAFAQLQMRSQMLLGLATIS